MDELVQYVRRRVPVRARLLGPERLREIVKEAVLRWPSQELTACCRGSDQERQVLDALAQQVGSGYRSSSSGEREYGMIWMLLLSSVISAIVQVIVKWWLERRSNRTMMLVWQQEAMQ